MNIAERVLQLKADLDAVYDAGQKQAISALPIYKGEIVISFTIDGTSYQAEKGMTWAEWCDSEYDTEGYFPHGSVSLDEKVSVYLDGNLVSDDDEVIDGGIYTHGDYVSGNPGSND